MGVLSDLAMVLRQWAVRLACVQTLLLWRSLKYVRVLSAPPPWEKETVYFIWEFETSICWLISFIQNKSSRGRQISEINSLAKLILNCSLEQWRPQRFSTRGTCPKILQLQQKMAFCLRKCSFSLM